MVPASYMPCSTHRKSIRRWILATSSVAELMQRWPLREPEEAVQLAAAEAIIDLAREIVGVIAAVNVVEEFSGSPEASSMTNKVIESKTPLPMALKEKLGMLIRS